MVTITNIVDKADLFNKFFCFTSVIQASYLVISYSSYPFYMKFSHLGSLSSFLRYFQNLWQGLASRSFIQIKVSWYWRKTIQVVRKLPSQSETQSCTRWSLLMKIYFLLSPRFCRTSFISQMRKWFFGGAPTSVCNFFCPSVCPSVVYHISGTMHHLIIIFGRYMQNDAISRLFFIFF